MAWLTPEWWIDSMCWNKCYTNVDTLLHESWYTVSRNLKHREFWEARCLVNLLELLPCLFLYFIFSQRCHCPQKNERWIAESNGKGDNWENKCLHIFIRMKRMVDVLSILIIYCSILTAILPELLTAENLRWNQDEVFLSVIIENIY